MEKIQGAKGQSWFLAASLLEAIRQKQSTWEKQMPREAQGTGTVLLASLAQGLLPGDCLQKQPFEGHLAQPRRWVGEDFCSQQAPVLSPQLPNTWEKISSWQMNWNEGLLPLEQGVKTMVLSAYVPETQEQVGLSQSSWAKGTSLGGRAYVSPGIPETWVFRQEPLAPGLGFVRGDCSPRVSLDAPLWDQGLLGGLLEALKNLGSPGAVPWSGPEDEATGQGRDSLFAPAYSWAGETQDPALAAPLTLQLDFKGMIGNMVIQRQDDLEQASQDIAQQVYEQLREAFQNIPTLV